MSRRWNLLVPLLACVFWTGDPATAAPAPAGPAWLTVGEPATSDALPATPQGVPADRLVVRWLGTAGFSIQTARALVYIDPYLSRTGLWKLLTRPARADLGAIAAHVPGGAGFPLPRAVFAGHAHFDHFLDAPAVAQRLSCNLHASEEALRIAVAEGVPGSRCHPFVPGQVTVVGDLTIEAVAGGHSPMPTQLVAGGHIPNKVTWPMPFLDYKNGPVSTFVIRWRDRTLFHCGSALIDEQALAGRRIDVALTCVSGWTSNPEVWTHIGRTLQPKVIVPMHHDDFFKSFAEAPIDNPLAARAGALAAIARLMPTTRVIEPQFFAPLTIRSGP